MEIRRLTREGIEEFKHWLEGDRNEEGKVKILSEPLYSEHFIEKEIDENRSFESRYDFGLYLNEVLLDEDFNRLMSRESDGMWAWIALLFFDQLVSGDVRKYHHYIVERHGQQGSLAYRQGPRCAFELARIHGINAKVCLSGSMGRFGDMTEQLASRQKLVRNKAFFQVAYDLFFDGDKLKRGSSSKPKPIKKRKPGDRTGFGSARRLAVALDRLDLLFDTEVMSGTEFEGLLPREFSRWMSESEVAK